jgi:hypothetical protein
MIRLRTVAVRTVAIAALGLAMVGVPATANAASVPTGAAVSAAQVDICDTVSSIAAPILRLVDLGVISLGTALDLIVALTGLPLSEVLDCLDL